MRVVSRIMPLLRDILFFCTFARWFCKKIGDFVLLHVVQEILIEKALKRQQMLSPKWSALWKMTTRYKNAWEMRCFLNQCKILSVIEQIHHLTTKIPTDLDEALQYVSSFDRCCSPCNRIGWYRYSGFNFSHYDLPFPTRLFVWYGGLVLALYNYCGLVAPRLSLHNFWFHINTACFYVLREFPAALAAHRAPGEKAAVPI